MKFIQRSAYHLESECRRYTVDKVSTARGFRYTAWFRRVDPAKAKAARRDEPYTPPEDLGNFESADKAKAQCAQHRKLNLKTNQREETTTCPQPTQANSISLKRSA